MLAINTPARYNAIKYAGARLYTLSQWALQSSARGWTMPCDAKAIANVFLDFAKSEDQPLTQMKLQKLVYFAHGWHLGLTGKPLLDEQIQAWSFGPVVLSLYKEFADFGTRPINRLAMNFEYVETDDPLEVQYAPKAVSIDECCPGEDHEFIKRLLRKIWEVYGHFTAIQLSNMTHAEGTPWDQVNKKYGGRIPRYATIPDELIEQYFKKQLESQEK